LASAETVAADGAPLLAVRDLHTYYGDSYVLQGLSLALPAGRIVAILGRNGMGKTTLVRSIAGLTPPRRGEVIFRGTSLAGRPPFAIAQQGIALVPQGRRIFKSLTVRENLLLPTSGLARSRSRPAPGAGRKVWDFDAVLTEFPQLRERLDNAGGALSGGEQQMLAVGRALMANPELILMDEPSEGLSPRYVQHVGEIMRNLRAHGHAVLLVEQNLALAVSVADYVYVVSSGRFVFEGPPVALAAAGAVLDEHLGVSGAKTLP
jgi:branched-chain amino acid transport system ATP-binding protein